MLKATQHNWFGKSKYQKYKPTQRNALEYITQAPAPPHYFKQMFRKHINVTVRQCARFEVNVTVVFVVVVVVVSRRRRRPLSVRPVVRPVVVVRPLSVRPSRLEKDF